MSTDAVLPILKNNKDPHYRYKMPKLCAKVEGSGNGIKTVITNMSAISKSLNRPASYPIKYFGCELGAQVTMNNDYVVNGSHDVDKLINLLYGFIRKFVLCNKCSNPETNLTVERNTIHQKCIACGHAYVIPKGIHKLTTYIINHPPDSTGLSTYSAIGEGKSGGKSSKSKSSKSKNSSSPTNGNGHSATSPESHHNGIILTPASVEEDNEGWDDEFDEEELTEDAYKERMRELCEGTGNTGIYAAATKQSANIFYDTVKEKRDANQLGDAAVQIELLKQADVLGIRDKATLILSELLFTENILDEIKTHRMLLLRFCHENKKAQKYMLGGFEKLVGDVYKEALFPKIATILKQFYDEDVIEEDCFKEWAAKGASKKYVLKDISKTIHEKADPFITWLNEAETESESECEGSDENKPAADMRQQSLDDEDEDDDDDGIDLEFSHRVSGIQLTETNSGHVQATPHNAEVITGDSAAIVLDEEDIDNI